VVRAVFTLAFSIRFVDLHHVPQTGAALLAANHVSVLDPVVIALGPSARGRTLRFLAGAEFFERPLVGWALRGLHQIPIRRGEADWEALEEVAAVIRLGSLAGIFPEGRVGGTPHPGPGHKGAARIALAAGVPVVPIGIWGTQLRWPGGGPRLGRPWRPPVTVAYGRPIPTAGDPRSRADVRQLTDHLMDDIAALVGVARGG
jgi:1-acyl-sn-glycerol-3-phosphate acyltransferase